MKIDRRVLEDLSDKLAEIRKDPEQSRDLDMQAANQLFVAFHDESGASNQEQSAAA